MPQHYSRGYLEVVTGALLFGLIGIFVRLISGMPLGSIIFYRLFFALIIIAFYLSFCGRFNEVKLREKRKYIMLLGIFQAGAMFSYFTAIKYTTVSIAVLLLYTAPVYVTILSPLLLKEKITPNTIFALLLSITGVTIIVQPQTVFNDAGSGLNLTGAVTGMLSGVFYALMILVSRYLGNYYSGTAQAWWAFIVSMLIFLPFSIMVPAGVVVNNLLLLVLSGLLPTAAGAILYLNGLRLVRAQNASILGLLEPASAVVFAYLLLNEPVSSVILLGGGLILTGAILSGRDKPIGTLIT
ncbi:MAG: DMT family transporter [Candidatus Methanoperedens sp.]|jgi:drug/metabolite transporter (DMT)-like permease|nr:DMT family transporter [Candidatus Methanoperedens sp.]PKL52860.1 MAG: EamA family transporter [Candidatus Methanoperedenaceae archaeon HGW-Methanoperedenaceae-1]